MKINVSIHEEGKTTTLEDCTSFQVSTDDNTCHVRHNKTHLSFSFTSVIVYPNGMDGATFAFFREEGKKR